MSATPYKMYTLNGEQDEDHFGDFISTLTFLMGAERAHEVGRELLEFRRELVRPQPGGDHRLCELHTSVERRLREVIVRTERVTATASGDGMLRTIDSAPGQVSAPDVRDYLVAQRVARIVKQTDVLEWWKSSPYLLNLLGDGYKLGRELRASVASAPIRRQLAAALAEARLLEPDAIRQWEEIDPGNARMRSLINDTVRSGAWSLLWIPPAMPHYPLAGPYANPAVAGLTKRLVFSSWQVVPRAIAALVSYAAERELWQAGEPGAENTQDVRDARRGRLQFALSNDRLTGMPVLALLFPSTTLSALCDPRDFAAERHDNGELDDLRRWARSRIDEPLSAIIARAPTTGPEDESWYWAAPLLLDSARGNDGAQNWLERGDAVTAWSGREQDDGRWREHVERAQAAACGELELGRPPERLRDVIADIGLFGFGNSALRALGGISCEDDADEGEGELRVRAAQIAWSLRTLFNLAETCAFIPSLFRKLPYWRQCLEAGAAANKTVGSRQFHRRRICGRGLRFGRSACKALQAPPFPTMVMLLAGRWQMG
ncbi:MAG: hypothetical protein ACLP0J_28320 [Solirubrobacteraceae bacterium]